MRHPMNPAQSSADHVASVQPDSPRRRSWPTWLAVALALVLLTVVLAFVTSASLLFGLTGLVQDGVGVTINGEPWIFPSQELHELPALLAGAGVLVALLVLLVAVPLLVVLAILLTSGLAVAGVALGLGGALFAVLATAALALSPLWLLLLLLWWALRRKPPRAAAPGTTMST